MNDDNPVSVDVSMAFFAAVLVIFVFVSLQIARTSPAEEKPSIGERTPVAEAVPPSWQAVPERTSFAMLIDDSLHVLELDHFARGIDTPLAWVSLRDHGERSETATKGTPEGFELRLSTTAKDLPPEWVRTTIALTGAVSVDAETGEEACALAEAERAAILRPVITILVADRDGADLAPLARMTRVCGYRFRLTSMGRAASSGRFSIPIGLSEDAYTAERIFR